MIKKYNSIFLVLILILQVSYILSQVSDFGLYKNCVSYCRTDRTNAEMESESDLKTQDQAFVNYLFHTHMEANDYKFKDEYTANSADQNANCKEFQDILSKPTETNTDNKAQITKNDSCDDDSFINLLVENEAATTPNSIFKECKTECNPYLEILTQDKEDLTKKFYACNLACDYNVYQYNITIANEVQKKDLEAKNKAVANCFDTSTNDYCENFRGINIASFNSDISSTISDYWTLCQKDCDETVTEENEASENAWNSDAIIFYKKLQECIGGCWSQAVSQEFANITYIEYPQKEEKKNNFSSKLQYYQLHILIITLIALIISAI